MIGTRVRHFDHDGRARLVTFSTHLNIPILTSDGLCGRVTDAIELARQEFKFGLIAYVIMPEHVHLLFIPSQTTELGLIIGEIKRMASKAIHDLLQRMHYDLIREFTVKRNRHGDFALWKRRCYDHNCRTDESVWEKVNYCHHNPVKRGLVVSPQDWKWSSHRWYQGCRDVPLRMDVDSYP